jgi:uncharacterized protein YbjQ (UPF0145 family)
MRTKNNILVTTTPNLEGFKIKQYFKPISAHVVAGTNFFSDFFASFSDVFGGRSGTYQKQLSSIYTEAIEILKNSAFELGANCIIGLKVDLDEISGKGKSMFMITATGTAVVIDTANDNFQKETSKEISEEKLDFISVEKMEEFRRKKEIIQLVQSNKIVLDDSIWSFITINSIYEVANKILMIVIDASSQYESEHKWSYEQLLSYFFSLDTNFTTKLLFDNLMSDKCDDIIFKLIKDLLIFDSESLISYLQCDNEIFRKRAIKISIYDKQFFSKDDIVIYEKLIEIIKSNFKELGTHSTEKKLLSKEKEIWICQCGGKNDIEYYHCCRCGADIYGFYSNEVNPLDAINKLEENIEIIKNNIF